MSLVPILCYHSVASAPPELVRPYAVEEAIFSEHLDLIADRDLRTLTVSELLAAPDRADVDLERSVLVTFDDGFADVASAALPALQERGMRATLFATTGLLRDGPTPPIAPALAPHMLAWSQLPELQAANVEIGAHSHTHPHLDTLDRRAAWREVAHSKTLLEDAGLTVSTFAYPHGYSSARVRALVREAGYGGACAIKNTFSSPDDDPFALARLMISSETTKAQLGAWLDRRGAPPPPRRERTRTRGWRAYRRARAAVQRRPGRDPGWRELLQGD